MSGHDVETEMLFDEQGTLRDGVKDAIQADLRALGVTSITPAEVDAFLTKLQTEQRDPVAPGGDAPEKPATVDRAVEGVLVGKVVDRQDLVSKMPDETLRGIAVEQFRDAKLWIDRQKDPAAITGYAEKARQEEITFQREQEEKAHLERQAAERAAAAPQARKALSIVETLDEYERLGNVMAGLSDERGNRLRRTDGQPVKIADVEHGSEGREIQTQQQANLAGKRSHVDADGLVVDLVTDMFKQREALGRVLADLDVRLEYDRHTNRHALAGRDADVVTRAFSDRPPAEADRLAKDFANRLRRHRDGDGEVPLAIIAGLDREQALERGLAAPPSVEPPAEALANMPKLHPSLANSPGRTR